MKKLLLLLLLSVFLLTGMSQTALSLPFVPEIPDNEPLYFKFTNYEQISPSGAIVAPSGATEQNWGILDVTSVATGDLTGLPSGSTPTDHQLFARADGVWSDIGFGEEITGIFWGIQPDNTNVTDTIASTGGFLDLYYDPNDDFSSTYAPANRSADNMYTGATEGNFLARIEFLNGAISSGNPNTSIVGNVVPSPTGFTTGLADSFGGIVADVDGDGILYEPVDDGAWAYNLDTNYFDSYLGLNTADFRFKNSYNPYSTWNGPVGTDIAGAISDDPARAYSQPIPEPATMLLFGTGLLGLIGLGRRKFFKKG